MATIASGSGGNCTYIGTERTHVLIDAGVSMKRTAEGLRELGLELSDVDAVFVTHEHSDHISGLPMIEKHFGLPIYATDGTATGIRAADGRGVIDEGLVQIIRADEPVVVGDLTLCAVPIPHDAREPVAYTAAQGEKRVAVATDIGHIDAHMEAALAGLDALLLEANHDIRMLQTGPYPYPLKQRILSDTGHLSNDAAGELLSRVLHDRVKGILLGHLSEKNNLPALAFETVRVEIELSDTPWHGNDFMIDVAPRNGLSRVIEI